MQLTLCLDYMVGIRSMCSSSYSKPSELILSVVNARCCSCNLGKLCDEECARYTQQYGRLVRAVNVNWGCASRHWKAWWVLKGLLNLSDHACEKHEACARFLFFVRCADNTWRPPAHQPRERTWADFTRNPAEPRNVAKIAKALIDGWTTSSSMRKYSFNSVLFGRSSANESLNLICSLWTNKSTHATVKMTAINDMCSNMTFNSGKEDKAASGRLRKAKRHHSIVVPRVMRRPRTMRWQLKALEKRFAQQPHLVAKYIEQETTRLDKRAQKRDRTVERLEREWDAELVSMSGHERRWDGLVRDSTETKLSIQYSAVDGIYYEPSGCLQTATGLLHVPWPLPARRIDFPRAVAVADSRAIAADSDSSSSEEDGPSEDSDEQQEDAEQSPEQQVAPVTRRSARVAAAR